MPEVLIVHSQSPYRLIAAAQFTRAGFTYRAAENSTVALSEVGKKRPDAVFVSDNLGVGSVSPAQLIASLRENAESDDMKIIFSPARHDFGAVDKANLAGADAHIFAPFKDEELAAVLKNLGLRE
jgi:DNA-binding response OmpR family regulator